MGQGVVEDVLRHNLSAYLPQMFPNNPWWVSYHVIDSEKQLHFFTEGKSSYGFVDALVGATAIEYEKDLTNLQLFESGFNQVKDYCAGLLNDGQPASLIVGVLSDTLHWYAYRIKNILPLNSVSEATSFGRNHLELEEIDRADFSAGGLREAQLLGEFLVKYLGREGARLLGAETLAFDLGFSSQFCRRHIHAIRDLVTAAFESNEGYAELIKKLWSDFVSYLGELGKLSGFDQDTYIGELYILTLAKLLCANVLEAKALASNEDELASILDGEFFKARSLSNLVEYDYFGWLNEPPHVRILIPIAQDMQDDLRAYDFASSPAEDLFGSIMAQLAERSQRLLLGQEFTPAWLAEQIVSEVFEQFLDDVTPRLVDMCCGSGAMIVEAVKHAAARLQVTGAVANTATMTFLTSVITGFDIDPLAVMLSKVGWVLAAREWLAGTEIEEISIPIYHADSLFAITPLTKNVDTSDNTASYELILDDKVVELPTFLISSEHASLFDTLLDRGYAMAMASARQSTLTVTSNGVHELVTQALLDTGDSLTEDEESETHKFCMELLISLDMLQRVGHNGIWAFVLRNSYRPGLVAGQFNGLVSNPPWLALSKVADNPYKDALRDRAEGYGIKPGGSSHLHIELATTFLLHAIEKYLADNAVIGCVLPETILSAHHHNPFREANYQKTAKPVPFLVNNIWRVEKGTFKNEAIVLFGKKEITHKAIPDSINGKMVSPLGMTELTFKRISQGRRTAWSDTLAAGDGMNGFFNPAEFRQGADIMPRTLIFHEITPLSPSSSKWNVKPIDRSTGSLRYLIEDAKKHKTFTLTANGIDRKFVFEILLSNHLTPFDIGAPAKALLPIEKNADGQWIPISETSLAAYGAATSQAFDRIFKADGLSSSQKFFNKLDSARGKLSSQLIPLEGWLIFMGAGGALPCAAYAPADKFTNKLIVDQTLYWAAVPTEDEAIYLVGLLNSEAINLIIKDFQPRGQFGARHIHKLPLGVTPPFNPLDASHVDVVSKTRSLLDEWNTIKTTSTAIQVYLDPAKSKLHIRRSGLRDSLKSLVSYADYELACKNLYGV
ncbi:MAG: hypothetical protein GC179_09990 [Anaerolineaceae bacterium]|nr:hypothetical protein [Anaerolineaceae bacterium]